MRLSGADLAKDIEEIVCKALEAWFAEEGGGADV